MAETTTPATKATVQYDAASALTFTNQAKGAVALANDYVIDSPSMLESAAHDLRNIKTLQARVEEERQKIAGPLFKAKQAVDALFKVPADFLASAEQQLKRVMLAWTTEQQRLADEAKRKADELARQERARLAELQRKQEEEAQASAAAALKAMADAEAARKAGDAEAAAKLQAEATQQAEQSAAQLAAADATAQEADVITMTPEVTEPAKVAGISQRTQYSARVDVFMDLVKAVAAGGAPIEALEPNLIFLGQQARAFKKAGQLYPGVTAFAVQNIAAKRA